MKHLAIVKQDEKQVVIQFTVKLTGSLLENEEALQQNLNAAGSLAMEPILKRFDTDGTPIVIAKQKLTSRCRQNQTYETPYGQVAIERHVYQTSQGGKTFCPLEDRGRCLLNSTPRYAKIISSKYCEMGADALRKDLLEANGRKVSRNYVKRISDFVGSIAQAKEEVWEYEMPVPEKSVAAISIGLDGTCLLMRESGWREAMCGSIALYDQHGERLHTIYAGASPEYGKQTFCERFSREVERVKQAFPEALSLGLADGAADNWKFLEKRTDRQMIDFYHAREYLGKAAAAIHSRRIKQVATQEEEWSHDLKHTRGAAKRILGKMEGELGEMKRGWRKEQLKKSATYFRNHQAKRQYWRHEKELLPIGSGVTEAACKVLIKQRLGQSGMRWKEEGAAALISIRSLRLTPGRWESFWGKVDQYGVPVLN